MTKEKSKKKEVGSEVIDNADKPKDLDSERFTK